LPEVHLPGYFISALRTAMAKRASLNITVVIVGNILNGYPDIFLLINTQANGTYL
jgi:hypothetical protein